LFPLTIPAGLEYAPSSALWFAAVEANTRTHKRRAGEETEKPLAARTFYSPLEAIFERARLTAGSRFRARRPAIRVFSRSPLVLWVSANHAL
jgi:hypothetical protein